MQPDNSEESVVVLLLLQITDENKFDYSLDGPRLQPIKAGCRLYSKVESHHHSCICKIRCTYGEIYSTGCVI